LAEKLFSGGHTEYAPDASGKISPNFVKDKPGTIFRNILAGSLLGMAAGSQSHDFAGGMGRGAAAGMERNQQTDQQRYDRAQQQFTDQQGARNQDTERTLRAAQTAQSHAETLRLAQEMDLHSPESIRTANSTYNEKLTQAEKAGGEPARIMVQGRDWNGTPGNALGFFRLYTQNPDAFKPPAGVTRVETLRVDTDGLTFDQHTDPATGAVLDRWLDSNGRPANIDERTTVTFTDIPESALTRTESVSGKEINRLYGGPFVPEDGTYPLTLQDRLGIAREGIKNVNDSLRAKSTAVRNEAAASASRSKAAGGRGGKSPDPLAGIKQQIKIAQTELNAATKTGQWDDAAVTQARQKLDGLFGQLDAAQKNPQGGRPSVSQSVQAAPHKVGDIVRLKSGQSVKVTSVTPDGRFVGEPIQ
jgi:hypothetical protein